MSVAVVFSVLCFLVFLISHNAAFYAFKNYSRAKIISNTFKLVVLGFLVLMFLSSRSKYFINGSPFYIHNVYVESLYGVAILISLFILYVPFYYTIVTSLSVQSMIFISANTLSKKATTLSWLGEQFISKNLIRDRLSLMVHNKYIYPMGNKYYVTSKGRRTALFFSKLKSVWRLGAGG